MKLSSIILGQSVVKQLEATFGEAVLVVGADKFTRRQLASVSCFNFLAAKNLTTLIRDFGVRDLKDLYERLPPAALAVPHMGAISMAVLGAAFEVKKIGGDDPLGNCARHHAGDAKRALVTFHTMKARELAAERATKQEQKRRKRARQAAAHTLRVDRFTERQAAASA